MMSRRGAFFAALVVTSSAAVGCQSRPSARYEQPYRHYRAVVYQPDTTATTLNLSMPGVGLLEMGQLTEVDDPMRGQSAMEYSRNDVRMGSPPDPWPNRVRLVQIQHREHLRTINSRPREYSTTITRTLEYGADW